MIVNRYFRGIAGAFVLISALLGFFKNKKFLIITCMVGFMIFQSAFTRWCPIIPFFKKLGIKDPELV